MKSPYNKDNSDPTQASRFDEGKVRLELAPTSLMAAAARAFEYGVEAHGEWNWAKGFPWLQPYASLMRHLAAWHEGQDIDSESGLSNLDHMAANLAMLIEFRDKGTGVDNRKYVTEARWKAEIEARDKKDLKGPML